MEPTKLRPTQQPMENMSHLMEKRNNVIMSHQRRLRRRRFRQIRYHGCERVGALAVGLFEAWKETPDGCMGVF